MGDQPTGTVTFLFTDIEGSTRRWQDDPDAMRAQLARHDDIWRSAIAEHSGYLFKHTGDGVAAAFASALDAATAAVSARAELDDVLPVRIGLHTGEAQQRGGDYFGTTLNRCARLMGIAHGGQCVVSEATAALLRGVHSLHDMGQHRLRDLSLPEHVWQLDDGAFPPLRSIDSFDTNLPSQLSSFIGRERELVAAATALADHRLVTLAGPGGVGKTRLALQAAADALSRFDAVWFVDLAPLAVPDQVAPAIASVMQLTVRAGLTAQQAIAEVLQGRRALLVIDNCEHLVDAVAEVVDGLLRACRETRFLCTTREALGVEGEQVLPLKPLQIDGAGSSDAVRLFMERACLVRPDFSLDRQSEAQVIAVCERLDGIPLAIELAAARVASLGPADILRRLDERFRLLTGGQRNRRERHHTMRTAIDWSYHLLDETERIVFDRLSVFAGGFTPDAAEAVAGAGDIDEWEVVDALQRLVQKSMVTATDSTMGMIRYGMLETLRQYGADRLHERGDSEEVRRRHAQWCRAFARDAEAGASGPDDATWLRRVIGERDNISTAVEWAVNVGDAALALGIVADLNIYVVFQPGLGLLEITQRSLDAQGSAADHAHAMVLATLGAAEGQRGNLELALDLSDRALRNDTAAVNHEFNVDFARAHSYTQLGRTDEAVTAADTALDRALHGDDPLRVVLSRMTRGCIRATYGDLAVGLAEGAAAIELADELGNSLATVSATFGLGYAQFVAGLDVAKDSLLRSKQTAEASGWRYLMGPTLQCLASLSARSGSLAEAVASLSEAVEQSRRDGMRVNIVSATAYTGQTLLRFGLTELATTMLAIASGTGIAHRAPGGFETASLDRDIASVQEMLRAEAFTAAWTRGASMRDDEAIEFVQRTLRSLATEAEGRSG